MSFISKKEIFHVLPHQYKYISKSCLISEILRSSNENIKLKNKKYI